MVLFGYNNAEIVDMIHFLLLHNFSSSLLLLLVLLNKITNNTIPVRSKYCIHFNRVCAEPRKPLQNSRFIAPHTKNISLYPLGCNTYQLPAEERKWAWRRLSVFPPSLFAFIIYAFFVRLTLPSSATTKFVGRTLLASCVLLYASYPSLALEDFVEYCDV